MKKSLKYFLIILFENQMQTASTSPCRRYMLLTSSVSSATSKTCFELTSSVLFTTSKQCFELTSSVLSTTSKQCFELTSSVLSTTSKQCFELTSSVLFTTSKQCFEQPVASFLVCSLIFIEYKTSKSLRNPRQDNLDAGCSFKNNFNLPG